MHTPNLDRLVREGCLYSNAYSPNPICMPARHNLITGLPSRYHGLPDNMFSKTLPYNLPTLPRILSDNGYYSVAIGKMHYSPVRRHNGFDSIELMEEVPRYREEDDYAMYLKEVGLGHIQNIHGVRNLLYMLPQQSLIPEEHHGTTWVADRAINFLKSNGGRRPFFLKASWIAPHPPFDVPKQYADIYKDAEIPFPHATERAFPPLIEENKYLGDHPSGKYIRRMRELYYAAITHVDYHIGRVLSTLEQIGQRDNTLIIFISDHGELLGDYGAYQKWFPYDSCARIPFIVRYPEKIQSGTVDYSFVDLNDILPTVLDVAGIEYPADIELPGESLFREGIKKKNRDYQYIEYSQGNRRWISLRDKWYKYNYYYGGGFEELFDIVNDPHETQNLLDGDQSKEVTAIREVLKKRLIEYEKKYGLKGYVKNNSFITLERYEPYPTRNMAFPVFPDTIMDEEEKKTMNNFVDEVVQAVEPESVVDLRELDLKAWQKNGDINDETIKSMLEKAAKGRTE